MVMKQVDALCLFALLNRSLSAIFNSSLLLAPRGSLLERKVFEEKLSSKKGLINFGQKDGLKDSLGRL